jgi:3'-phosphoadenosine 5'-phosphosulfate sulfotransferase (PAPS reductase)/FAD synthetase
MTNEQLQNAQVIFANHSGGKDSQAMLAKLVRMGLKDKIVIIHADLGEMEWEPMHGWIEKNSFGIPVHVVKAEMSFFDLCRKYKRLPSGQARFCTNLLKTVPCENFMKKYCEERGITNAVSVLGIRADESGNRAKMSPLSRKGKVNRATKFKMELTIWYPIFEYTLDEVKKEVADADQELHEVYANGYSRLSCVFCPLARIAEHKKMAKDKPELFQKMVNLERELGKTIRLKQKNKVKYNRYLDEYCSTKKEDASES